MVIIYSKYPHSWNLIIIFSIWFNLEIVSTPRSTNDQSFALGNRFNDFRDKLAQQGKTPNVIRAEYFQPASLWEFYTRTSILAVAEEKSELKK